MPKFDLLPCPFCGKLETLKMQTVPSEYRVLCDIFYGGCGASTGWNHTTPEEAAKAWNTRASGWIPCSKRIPGDDANVLAYNDGDGVLIASYDHYAREWKEAFECYPLTNVTHWMHLPNPPAPADKPCGGDDNAEI